MTRTIRVYFDYCPGLCDRNIFFWTEVSYAPPEGFTRYRCDITIEDTHGVVSQNVEQVKEGE